MKVLATICARGGSKGVPGKNIRPLVGKPMIAYTIETSLACTDVGRMIISTDSPEIAKVAEGLGVEVPFLRPAEMASDQAPKIQAITHATEFVERTYGFMPDVVADLDVGSPLRIPDDISSCVKVLANDPELDAAVTVYEAERNPYFNMVEPDGKLIKLVKPGANAVARQSAPVVYSVSGSVFAWRRGSMASVTHLYEGKWGKCVIPRERALDVDFELDFNFMEFMLERMGQSKEEE